MSRDHEGTRKKGCIQSNVRFGPVSDIKVCNNNGGYSIKVLVQSLFRDQTVTWIRFVNGIDKFVREATSIQEEEKASGKPLYQQDQYSNRCQQLVGTIPIEQGKLMDIEK